MQQPSDVRLTSQLAQDVCVRTASAAVLDGSIASLGTQYVIALRARNCSTGDILADEQTQAARKEDVLGALSQIAIRFRTRVGESLATIEKHSMPLEEATTPSLEAWKAFTTASRAYYSSGAAEALPLFKRAVAIDPDFAIAHARLGIHYSNVRESTLARESTLEAYRLRDRASDVERFYIDTFYDRQVTGNLERQQQTMESWARTYPRDPVPHGLLAGLATMSTGRYELSIAAADKALALEPGRPPTYNAKARSQVLLNRLADAEATLDRATEGTLDEYPDFFLTRLLHRLLERRWRGHETTGGAGQGEALHGRHDLAHGGARPGSLRPFGRSETHVRGCRRHRAAVGSARAGGLVRRGNGGVGSVLRKWCGSEAAGNPGPRARQGPRRGLCRGLRAGSLRRCGAIAGACRRTCEELS